MPQLPDQRVPLTLPSNTSYLIITMDWALSEIIQPDPWVVAFSGHNPGVAIDGQHAHPGYRYTYGGVVGMERHEQETSVSIDLAALRIHCPDAGGVSFLANLYFGPQSGSTVTFDNLAKASIEIAATRQGYDTEHVLRHEINPADVKRGADQLPLASIVREGDDWTFVPEWTPLRYRF